MLLGVGMLLGLGCTLYAYMLLDDFRTGDQP